MMEILNTNLENLNYIGIHSKNFKLSHIDKKFLNPRLNNLKELVPAYASMILRISCKNTHYVGTLCVNAYDIQLISTKRNETICDLYIELEKDILNQDEGEIFEHCRERCVIIIDINHLRDHGFSLASRIARVHKRECFIVGLCTLPVDYQNSYFDYFFTSLSSLKNHFYSIENGHHAPRNIKPFLLNDLNNKKQLSLIC